MTRIVMIAAMIGVVFATAMPAFAHQGDNKRPNHCWENALREGHNRGH